MAPESTADHSNTSTNHIKNVAIVGATGHLGQHITASLLQTGFHKITALTRPESKSPIPSGVHTIKVTYTDHPSLVTALQNQDALIITMSNAAPSDSIPNLVTAALEAGVPWILPNEWGGDYLDPEINRDTRLGDSQLEIRKLIASSDKSWYIAVSCGFWYDYSLPGTTYTLGFDIPRKHATFYDDGNFKMHYSTLPYCGEAVARLLSLPITPTPGSDPSNVCISQFRNSILPIHAFTLTQRDILASILRVTGDKESDWTIGHESSRKRYLDGKRLLDEEGQRMGWRLMLYARMFWPENERKARKEEESVDGLLGLVRPEVDGVTAWALEVVERGGV